MGRIYDCPGCDMETRRRGRMVGHLKKMHPERVKMLAGRFGQASVTGEDPVEKAAGMIADASETESTLERE